MTEDSQQRLERLQTLLNRRLGPEFISHRTGGGGSRISYIEGWRVINLANEVFGFNGWFTAIKELTVDYCDLAPDSGRFNIGVSAIVRVWLRDGASHEDVGYGRADNQKTKGDGLDKAKKEAVTDALKRTLRNFGNLLGNCLYDKAHVAAVSQIKPQKVGLDWDNLHRADSTMQPEPRSTAASKPVIAQPARPAAPPPPPQPPRQERTAPQARQPQRAQTVAAPAITRIQQESAAQTDRSSTSDLLRDSDDELFASIPIVDTELVRTEDSGFIDGETCPDRDGDESMHDSANAQAREDADKAMRKLLAEKKQAEFRKKREMQQLQHQSHQVKQKSPEQAMRPPPTPSSRPAHAQPPDRPMMRAQSHALPALHVGGPAARLHAGAPTAQNQNLGFHSARGIKRDAPSEGREPLGELDIGEYGDVKRAR